MRTDSTTVDIARNLVVRFPIVLLATVGCAHSNSLPTQPSGRGTFLPLDSNGKAGAVAVRFGEVVLPDGTSVGAQTARVRELIPDETPGSWIFVLAEPLVPDHTVAIRFEEDALSNDSHIRFLFRRPSATGRDKNQPLFVKIRQGAVCTVPVAKITGISGSLERVAVTELIMGSGPGCKLIDDWNLVRIGRYIWTVEPGSKLSFSARAKMEQLDKQQSVTLEMIQKRLREQAEQNRVSASRDVDGMNADPKAGGDAPAGPEGQPGSTGAESRGAEVQPAQAGIPTPTAEPTRPKNIGVRITGHIPDSSSRIIERIALSKTRIQLMPAGTLELAPDADGRPQYTSKYKAIQVPANGSLRYKERIPPGRYFLSIVNVDLSKISEGPMAYKGARWSGGSRFVWDGWESIGSAFPPLIILSHAGGQSIEIASTMKAGTVVDLGELTVVGTREAVR